MLATALVALFQIPAVAGEPVAHASLRRIDIRQGTGEAAQPGQEYKVHYTGWLTDGSKFDSSVDRNEPFAFIQGRRQVIAGWEAGFEGMRVGGKRRLLIPYQFAYGEKGRGPIPPRAELVFDVELLGVRDVPEERPARELLLPIDEARKKLLALARAIPEEKYGWRPSPQARPVAEVVAHIALGTRLMADLAEKTPDPAEFKKRVEEQWRSERQPRTKAELVAMLEESLADLHKRVEPLRMGILNRDLTLFGQPNTVRGAYIATVGHLGEHLGQLIAYARTAGVKPPWSQE